MQANINKVDVHIYVKQLLVNDFLWGHNIMACNSNRGSGLGKERELDIGIIKNQTSHFNMVSALSLCLNPSSKNIYKPAL